MFDSKMFGYLGLCSMLGCSVVLHPFLGSELNPCHVHSIMEILFSKKSKKIWLGLCSTIGRQPEDQPMHS
jgi:hypothetical protein